MKKILFVILITVVLFISCNKSKEETPYICAACTKTPQALAANNSSSKGIYKGVFFGSTGTISFDIQNNSAAVTATLILDGVTVSFSSGTLPQTGQPYTATFAGTINGQPASINFSVGADGSSPVITAASIPGHPNTGFGLLKETSSGLVESFEGTWKESSSTNGGTLNMVVSRTANSWNVVKGDSGNPPQYFNGSISGNNLICNCPLGLSIIGTFSGDQADGQYNSTNNGTWTIRRTL